MRVDGLLEKEKKIIKTVEIWFYLGRGMCWEEDGDEDDGR